MASLLHALRFAARRPGMAAAGCAAAAAATAGTATLCSGAKVTSSKALANTRFLELLHLDYLDDNGVARPWDMVQRVGNPIVVNVLMIMKSKGMKPGEEETCLTCQFRPPLKAYALELPAAIVAKGESIDECALRCAMSETGYVGTVRVKSPISCSSAGLTSESASLVIVDINLDDYTTEEYVTREVGGKRKNKMKKTVKVSGESWIPEQSLDKEDQIIEIRKIKVRMQCKYAHFARACVCHAAAPAIPTAAVPCLSAPHETSRSIRPHLWQLKELQQHINAACREGVVSSIGLQSFATGMAFAGMGSFPTEEKPPKRSGSWF